MFKSLLIAACLLGSAAFATNVALADDAKPTTPKAKPVAPTVGCTHETGSRLPPKKDGCAGVGRSYSKDEISSTGATTAGGALRLLDPSITGH
jgi:hypothetical protein